MLLAPALGEPPRDDRRAARRGAAATGSATRVERVEVAGPGFLNLFLADAWYLARGRRGARRRRRASAPAAAAAERVQVEFVSANPTGPLTAAARPPRRLRRRARADPRARRPRGRARVLLQRRRRRRSQRLGESIRARARGEEPPEDGYQGDYVAELARADPRRRRGKTPTSSRAAGVEILMARHPRDARALPRALRPLVPRAHAPRGRPERRGSARSRALERATATPTAPRARCGCARPRCGDDKDRVLVRSTGEPTYFAADVAYH